MAKVAIFDDFQTILGEGPVWDEASNALLWIDITGRKVLKKSPQSERITYSTDDMIGSFSLLEGDPHSLLLATGIGLQKLDLKTGKSETVLERTSLEEMGNNRFNDGKCDAKGRFWAGTMDRNGSVRKKGSLYCYSGGKATLHRRPVSISNGIAWSWDNKKMFYVDSPEKTLLVFDFDLETGTLSNEKVIAHQETPEAVFDGMTIDEEGKLWVALWGGACIRRYDADTGALLLEVPIPALNVTSCVFGGPNWDELYVTSASCDTDLSKYPDAGKTFLLSGLGVRGRPFYRFKGNF